MAQFRAEGKSADRPRTAVQTLRAALSSTKNVTCACGQMTFATHDPHRRRRQVDVMLGPAQAPDPQNETRRP